MVPKPNKSCIVFFALSVALAIAVFTAPHLFFNGAGYSSILGDAVGVANTRVALATEQVNGSMITENIADGQMVITDEYIVYVDDQGMAYEYKLSNTYQTRPEVEPSPPNSIDSGINTNNGGSASGSLDSDKIYDDKGEETAEVYPNQEETDEPDTGAAA